MPDDQLSASQLRAKAAIPRNTWKRPEDQSGGGLNPLVVVLAILMLAGVVVYLIH